MLEKSVQELQSVIRELEARLQAVDKERTEVSKALGLTRDAIVVLTPGFQRGGQCT